MLLFSRRRRWVSVNAVEERSGQGRSLCGGRPVPSTGTGRSIVPARGLDHRAGTPERCRGIGAALGSARQRTCPARQRESMADYSAPPMLSSPR